MGMVEKSAEVEKFIKDVKRRNLKIVPFRKTQFCIAMARFYHGKFQTMICSADCSVFLLLTKLLGCLVVLVMHNFSRNETNTPGHILVLVLIISNHNMTLMICDILMSDKLSVIDKPSRNHNQNFTYFYD